MFSLAIFRAVPQLTEHLEEVKETNGSTGLNLHLGVLRKKLNSDESDTYLAFEFFFSRMVVVTVTVTIG